MIFSNHLYKISLITIFSILSIVILKVVSANSITKNGFVRDKNSISNLTKLVKLSNSQNYFAGRTAENIFIANIKSPFEILKFSNDLIDSISIKLTYKDELDIFKDIGRISVDSSVIHFSEGVTPAFFSGSFYDLSLYNDHDSVSFFLSSYLLYGATWVIDSYSSVDKQRILLKKSPAVVGQSVKYIPEKQVDGTFCTQGTLSYSRETHTLFYTFLYRNKFICLDTNLVKIYEGSTLDTNSIAKIKVDRINDRKTKLSAPPVGINKYTYADNGILYIQSALFGDNEDPRDFEGMAPIDQYSTSDGRYLGSFLIPRSLNHSNLETFIVVNRSIVALYGNQLATFTIKQTDNKTASNP